VLTIDASCREKKVQKGEMFLFLYGISADGVNQSYNMRKWGLGREKKRRKPRNTVAKDKKRSEEGPAL